jgi:hypothetical protein
MYPDEAQYYQFLFSPNAIPSQDNRWLKKSKQNGEASKNAGCDNTKTI